MKRSKYAFSVLFVVLFAAIITGCGNSYETANNKKKILCTSFAAYDWVCNIVGDNNEQIQVSLLIKNGADMHNYQPSASDIIEIKSSDLFIYTGGESDDWVMDVITNKNQDECVNLIHILGDKAIKEEHDEGIGEHEHDNLEKMIEGSHEHEEETADEHVWLSIVNAKFFVEEISHKVINLDKENKEKYIDNLERYINKLKKLDDKYKKMVSDAKRRTILFADRFPFRYLVEDYGLNYYAAFEGCSAESEASFETIAFLSSKLESENLPAVLVIENSDKTVAKAVINNTKDKKQKILEINSLQSVTEDELNNGISYISVMEENMDILKQALY